MTRAAVILIALLAGAGMALQVGFNSTLKERVGHPFHAALISFASGTVLLGVLSWSARGHWAPVSRAAAGPWWMWLGGCTGVVYVASSAALANRVGGAAWLGMIIAGQLIASLVLDHYGLLGFSAHPINPLRIAGAGLLLLGAYLLLK